MKQVLITIDTEIGELGKNMTDAFEIFIEGKIDNREVGYRFIMDTLEKYGITGHFFVDVYPFKVLGEEKFRSLAQEIYRRSHCIHLHTHPSTAFDKDRIYLNQYSLEEQVDILKFGSEKIKEWTGRYPIAHRAGGYAINEDTFKALRRANIFYDFSFFYGNQNCKFLRNTVNIPFEVDEVKEIPVTLFEEEADYGFLNLSVLKKKSFKKLDLRYGANLEEIKNVILNSDDGIFVIFLHSFNFLNLPYNFKENRYHKIGINNGIVGEFENLLKWLILQKDVVFPLIQDIDINDFGKDNVIKTYSKKAILPRIINKFKYKILNIGEI